MGVPCRQPGRGSGQLLTGQHAGAGARGHWHVAQERRQHWQRCHLAALEPWIPAKEAARLRSEVSVAEPAPPLPRLEQQPAQINGVLKEYQVCTDPTVQSQP